MLWIMESDTVVLPSLEIVKTGRLKHASRMDWWRRARFGMFIHWGPYSLFGGEWGGDRVDDGIGYGVGEWIMYNAQIPVVAYEAVARQFNPVDFDADAWVRIAKNAGQRYMIITAKHHDGFALFQSGVSDFNSVDGAPFGRDIIAELAEACSREGIRFGIYYSHAQDWHHPGGAAFNGRSEPTAPWSGGEPGAGRWDPTQEGDFDNYLANIALPQVRELLTKYGPIDIFWWDTPIGMTPERAEPLDALLRLQPGVITNNRLLDPDHPNVYSGDTETPEQFIPATGLADRDFEVCMTMNDTWGFKTHDHNWKSSDVLIRQLVDTVSKGGNFLLNIGPDGQGNIPEECLERMAMVGDWMSVNGESIYEATASPFAKLPWGRCTRREQSDGTCLYLHVFSWPSSGELLVPGLRTPLLNAQLLAGDLTLENYQKDGDTFVKLPSRMPDTSVSVIRLKLSGALDVGTASPVLGSKGPLVLSAWQANIYNRSYGGQAVLDYEQGRSIIRGWTDTQTRLTWSFTVAAATSCHVIAGCHAIAGSGRLKVTISGETHEVPFTLSEAPCDISFGSFSLPQGEYILELEPVAGEWTPIELLSVTLMTS